jgi:hypothetical protein
VVSRLGTEGAIFRAGAGFHVADAAQVNHVAATGLAHAIGGGAKGQNICLIINLGQDQGRGSLDRLTGNDSIGQLI